MLHLWANAQYKESTLLRLKSQSDGLKNQAHQNTCLLWVWVRSQSNCIQIIWKDNIRSSCQTHTHKAQASLFPHSHIRLIWIHQLPKLKSMIWFTYCINSLEMHATLFTSHNGWIFLLYFNFSISPYQEGSQGTLCLRCNVKIQGDEHNMKKMITVAKQKSDHIRQKTKENPLSKTVQHSCPVSARARTRTPNGAYFMDNCNMQPAS